MGIIFIIDSDKNHDHKVWFVPGSVQFKVRSDSSIFVCQS